MSDLGKDVARLDERTNSHADRIEKIETKSQEKLEKKDVDPMDRRISVLESNQRWFVLTTIGLMLKAAFDYFKGGGAP